MTAALAALPGLTRLVVAADLTLAERRCNLRWLADRTIADPDDWPESIIADALSMYADPTLTPDEKAQRFESYKQARRDELEARDGRLVWSALSDDMGPQGHHYSAEEQATQNAHDALRSLAGTNGGN